MSIAIRVQNLSKCYQIYEAPSDRLKQFVVPQLRRLARLSSKQYFREFWALKDISFEIKKGETVGIIGRNGSGKIDYILHVENKQAGNWLENSGKISRCE